MTKDTKLSELVINKLTTEQYNSITTKDPNQLYIVTDAPGFDESRTNCITEIPQNIKLELNDGTLTLKAGSKVYAPNGFEDDGTTPKFDEVVIESDTVVTNATGTEQYLIFYLNGSFRNQLATACYSGTTAPTITETHAAWYDTANNKIKLTNDTGATWTSGIWSFPICSTNTTSGVFSSIDQVFNGFGYIGSTIFALPGVKILIPNGRNADGSLKNVEFTSDIIRMQTFPSSWAFTNFPVVLLTNNFGVYEPNNFVYKELENLTWNNGDKVYVNGVKVVDISVTNGVITSFTPKLPFCAVDRSDSSWVSAQAMPSSKYIDLTLGATGSTYTAPANGWVSVNAGATSSVAYVMITNLNTSLSIMSWVTISGNTVAGYVPAKKGEVVSVYYYNIDNANFRFIYAEGEN